jgi:diguanylate cyclase (GGDEF)-like protein
MVADHCFPTLREGDASGVPGLPRRAANYDHVLTLLAVACAAVLAFAVGAVVARRRSERRYEAALARLDGAIDPVSETLRDAAERLDEVRAAGPQGAQSLTPNLEQLLERIAAEGMPARAFRQLAVELAPELADAPQLPIAKRPPPRDDLTGVRDRRGYETELEREIARAARTGRPLALVLLDLGDLVDTRVRAGHAEVDRLLQEFAALLVRVTRATDTVCRRRGGQFGILLPETNETGARHFRQRVREEASRASFGRLGQVTFSTGIVEWRSRETGDDLDTRARATIGRAAVRTLEPPEDADGGLLDAPQAP